MRLATAIAGVLACATTAVAAQALRNWFDDPFFPLASAIADCPEPAGPRVTEAERRVQAHRRAEKGTTCWLAKEQDCERASAYTYDQGIAIDIRNAFAGNDLLARSSLWVTVQGRVVYVEGCVPTASDGQAIEDLVRGLPHVQQALAIVRTGAGARIPYRVLGRRPGPERSVALVVSAGRTGALAAHSPRCLPPKPPSSQAPPRPCSRPPRLSRPG